MLNQRPVNLSVEVVAYIINRMLQNVPEVWVMSDSSVDMLIKEFNINTFKVQNVVANLNLSQVALN